MHITRLLSIVAMVSFLTISTAGAVDTQHSGKVSFTDKDRKKAATSYTVTSNCLYDDKAHFTKFYDTYNENGKIHKGKGNSVGANEREHHLNLAVDRCAKVGDTEAMKLAQLGKNICHRSAGDSGANEADANFKKMDTVRGMQCVAYSDCLLMNLKDLNPSKDKGVTLVLVWQNHAGYNAAQGSCSVGASTTSP